VKTIVVDALQVGRQPSGVGRLVRQIGSELYDLPGDCELELRCTREALPLLRDAFPASTRVRTPLRRSRPRVLRIAYQQLVAPLRDPSSTLLVCPGDQGPLRGRARVVLGINDLRRLALPGSSGRSETAFYRFLVPRAARRAIAVVTISEYSRQEIERLFGLRAEVICVHPPPRNEPLAGDEHLLVVGALRPYKSVETVIEAVARLAPEERRVVRLAGPEEGRRADVLRLAEQRGVAPWVEVLGWVSEHELEQLYAEALATICPSTYEGYGLSLAEGLARGVPALASDIPAHREVAGDAALFFPPGNSASLADGLRKLSSNPDFRLFLGRRGLERSRALRRARPSWRDVVLRSTQIRGLSSGSAG
jgi:glycosyltransferase involved in cell wall biosynthesis